MTLDGDGTVTLDGSHDEITGTHSGTLKNYDTISGSGTIGGGLTLNNEGGATVDADVHNKTLTVDTGHTITNEGTLEASNGGTLQIEDAVTNSGAGYALIKGGILQLDASASMGGATDGVAFDNGGGIGVGTDYGELVLGDWRQFSGDIKGFDGTAANAASSDEIELLNFTGRHLTDVAHYDSDTGITTLTISDSSNSDSLKFVGDYTTSDFAVERVGATSKFSTPPASNNSTPSVSIGGPGNDTFVFAPGVGAETLTNFNPQADTIELDHFRQRAEHAATGCGHQHGRPRRRGAWARPQRQHLHPRRQRDLSAAASDQPSAPALIVGRERCRIGKQRMASGK